MTGWLSGARGEAQTPILSAVAGQAAVSSRRMTDAPAPSPEPSSPPTPPAATPATATATTPAPAAARRGLRLSAAALELRKEGYTMGLYVAICLLGALIALPTHEQDDAEVIAIIWGVTVGLALAHWFAFRVSAALVSDGKVRRRDLHTASAQLAGAAFVALLASIPVLVSPKSAEFEAAELTLAAFIGWVGYALARNGGTSRMRAVVYGLVVLVFAVAIAIIKNALAGH